jgi:hypothetical protein
VLLAGIQLAGARDPWTELPRSVTRSGQFVVYCEDTRMRMEVGSFVETAKATALGVLGIGDQWAHPVVITLAPRPTAQPDQPVADLRLLDIDGGMKIEINIALGGDLSEARFPHRVIEAVLTEIAYRRTANSATGPSYRRPPEWLVAGIAILLPGRNGARQSSEVCRGLLQSNRIPPLDTVLQTRLAGIDSASQQLYEACSYALLRLLCDLPNGRRHLVRFVRSLPEKADCGAAELGAAFPALGESEIAREKWWALGVARLSGADRYRGLDFQESLEKLDAALAWEVPAEGNAGSVPVNLREHGKIGKAERDRAVLERISGQLLSLQAEAHPLVRPLVLEWQEIASRMAEGNRRGIAGRIERLESAQKATAKRVDAIADYLNWYQATNPTEKSGRFDAYLKAARDPGQTAANVSGHDPIARYLDNFERAMGEAQ